VKRSVLALVVALFAGIAVFGAAATLGVTSKKVDSFGADQAATTSSSTPGDTTAPTLVSLEMFDASTAGVGSTPNGKVDRVVATFNEPLQGSSSNTPWTLVGTPSGGVKGALSVVANSTVATLTITEGAGDADTAVGTFTVALAQDAGGIRDVAGNQASFPATSPTDRAKPIPVSLTIANGTGTAGRPDQGDTLSVKWSEELLTSSLCGSGFSAGAEFSGNLNQDNFVRIANLSPQDELTASMSCGLNFGSVALGSASFVGSTTSFGANAAGGRSSALWAPATRTFRLSLGSGVGTAVSAAVEAVYTPDTDIEDLADNNATGSVRTTAVQF